MSDTEPASNTEPASDTEPASKTGPASDAGSGRRLLRLVNEIRPYDWGSATTIPQLLGIEPTGQPAAEMWIGAHPGSPSRIAEPDPAQGAAGETLLGLIAADPDAMLGKRVVERFGPALPYLLKLLAAEQPLSLQTHPTIHQAREGYQAEDDDQVPLSASHRSYQDRNHKPELLCALTPFQALCGFRPVQDGAAFLRAAAAADPAAARLADLGDRLVAEGGLRDVVTGLLTLRAADQAELAAAAAAACAALAEAPGRWQPDAAAIVRIARLHPADVGVLLAMLLNYVQLAPGAAIYLAAGQIHAYLEGFGVELMASSDNVLRAGLTSKHVNVPELLRTVDFSAAPPHTLTAEPQESGEARFPTPAADFALARIELDGADSAILGAVLPSIVVCVEGSPTLASGTERLALAPGASAFVRAGSELTVTGPGVLFRASVGATATAAREGSR
jgi:mannose-6-phosphate isomerase